MVKRASGKGPKKAIQAAVALGCPVVQEDLPLPFVHYPSLYGTFIGFSHAKEESPVLCSCSEPAIRNYVRLNPCSSRPQNSHVLRMAPLSSGDFPESIAASSMAHDDDPLKGLRFEDGICHRCQMKTPSLRYCHPMYGGQFVQMYGWYVRQARLGLGVYQERLLEDVCPPEIQEPLRQLSEITQRCQRLVEIGASRNEATEQQQAELEGLRKGRSSLSRRIGNLIENETRRDFGVRSVGEGWISESILFQIVARQFEGHECKRHFRPSWLGGLELDIFIPEENIAFEYQGQQHFFPVEHWGAEKALDALRIRDARKVEFCREHGVFLVAFDFTEPLTEQHVQERMQLHS